MLDEKVFLKMVMDDLAGQCFEEYSKPTGTISEYMKSTAIAMMTFKYIGEMVKKCKESQRK